MALSGDTKISLLDGRELTVAELEQEYQTKNIGVYSCDNEGNIVPGLITSIQKITNPKVLTITLDNDEKFQCSENHWFLMRDGSSKQAKNLVLQDSLMPLYREINKKDRELIGYEKLYNPKDKRWYYTHRRIVFFTVGAYKGVVHHKNFNKRDNSVDNLQVMSWEDHTKLHASSGELLKTYAQSEKGRNKSRELMTALWNNGQRKVK